MGAAAVLQAPLAGKLLISDGSAYGREPTRPIAHRPPCGLLALLIGMGVA